VHTAPADLWAVRVPEFFSGGHSLLSHSRLTPCAALPFGSLDATVAGWRGLKPRKSQDVLDLELTVSRPLTAADIGLLVDELHITEEGRLLVENNGATLIMASVKPSNEEVTVTRRTHGLSMAKDVAGRHHHPP